MSDLEKIEEKKHSLVIGGRERELKFNFSAWKEIEKKYGSVNNLAQLTKDMSEKPFQTLPEIVYIALTDKEDLSRENCLDEFSMKEMQEITNAVSTALNAETTSSTGGRESWMVIFTTVRPTFLASSSRKRASLISAWICPLLVVMASSTV